MEKIVDILQAGDIITHAYHGGYHTIAENDYLAYKKAKEKGVIIDAGMAGGVHTDFAVLKNAIEKGCIPDVISSDITCFSAYMRGGIYGLPMCMSIARICGMKEIDVFKSVTLNAAKAVDKEEWFGLRVGVKATLSVMAWGDTQIDICDRAGNSLISEKGYVCKMAVKNGQIIYRN
jgi:dihydroorotase